MTSLPFVRRRNAMLAKFVTKFASPSLGDEMKIYTPLMLVASLALAACGQPDDRGTQTAESDAAAQSNSMSSAPGAGTQSVQPAGEVHAGNGDITELSNDSVTISHGPVESIGWPAMTMTFRASSPNLLQGLNVGDPVDFKFQQAGEQYVLTSITRARQ